jgi:hypothetical protein
VFGDQSNVRAYQAEQKTPAESEWRPASNYVAVNRDQQEYNVEVSSIGSEAEMRIRAIGPDGNSLSVSDTVKVNRPCKGKSLITLSISDISTYVNSEIVTPPTDVTLTRISADSVLMQWSYPNENVAECGLYFVISGTVDRSSLFFFITIEGEF